MKQQPRAMKAKVAAKVTEVKAPPVWFEGPLNDEECFAQYVPKKSDVVEIIPLLTDPELKAIMMVEVSYADKVDEEGMLCILRFLSADNEEVREWALKNVTGVTDGDDPSFHFCRKAKCKCGDRNTIHIHKWRHVPTDVDGDSLSDVESVPSESKEGGLAVLGSTKSKKVDATTAMRRVAELRDRLTGSSGGGAKSPGSGGSKLSSLAKALQKSKRSRSVSEGDVPVVKGKTSISQMLAERAAANASKSASLANERKKLQRLKSAKSSSAKKEDASSEASMDEKEDDDDDEDSVFREAPSLFRTSKILNVANREQGTLLNNGVELMARALSIHQRGGTGTLGGLHPPAQLQDVVTTYLTTALIPGANVAGQYMGKGTQRELRTLSEAMDAIIRGEKARAGDILMQRFRAIEMAVADGNWSLAQHLELIPDQAVCSVPLGMRGELIREENRRCKFRDFKGGKGAKRG